MLVSQGAAVSSPPLGESVVDAMPSSREDGGEGAAATESRDRLSLR